ncbi:MAG: DUF935 domain-containing protein [Magnetococcales bacterium]|nr:DUF935 domain-containing protein [Magnetococcales bacterium]
MAIVDKHGKPIVAEKLTKPQTAKLGEIERDFTIHPADGLTPGKVMRIFKEADEGDITAQAQLFSDMEERDPHLGSELSKRRRAALTLGWSIEPPANASSAEKKAAELVQELIVSIPDFEDVILNMLNAVGQGFSCLELEWGQFGKQWNIDTVHWRPNDWFMVPTGSLTEIRLKDKSEVGQELNPFGWIKHIHKARSGYLARSGLLRSLAGVYLLKGFAITEFSELLDIYGHPVRLGKYSEGATDKQKNTLLQAVTTLGRKAAGIIPMGMEIEFKEAAKGKEDPFEFAMSWCEKTVSKIVVGGTLTSQADGKSSTNALGNVHNEVRKDLLVSDVRQVGSTLTRDLVYPLSVLNTTITDPRRAPRFVFDVRELADLASFATGVSTLSTVLPIPAKWAYETTGIPVPDEDEAVLGPVNPAVAASKFSHKKACPGCGTATAKSEADHDDVDGLVDEHMGDWKPLLEPVINPIQELANSAESLEAFRDDLDKIVAELDSTALTDNLATASFIASGVGDGEG